MFQKIFDFLVKTVNDGGDISYYPTVAGNIALFLLIALIFLAMLVFSGSRKKGNAKQLAFCAVAITLAVVTSMYTVIHFPFGGSITLFRMLFICLIGYLYGPKVGVLTGIATGLLDLILKPYVVHPVQLLLDYPIAFGCLGLSGVFSKSKFGIMKGYLLGVFGRYFCHVLTGIIFFSSYAGSQNVVIYSISYNAMYIIPEAALTILLLLLPPVRWALLEVKKMAAEE